MNEIGQTPGEVSKTLDVTGATLRNYVKQFKPFLSENATKKTRKRFSPEDIQILKTAKSFLDAGLTYEQVSERLETLPALGEVIDEPEPETIFEDIPPAEEPTTAIQTREFYEQFFLPALDAKNETIQELKSDKERLQRQLNYERLPFFRKWFSKPPE